MPCLVPGASIAYAHNAECTHAHAGLRMGKQCREKHMDTPLETRVTVITFDLDNTLWSTRDAIKLCYTDFRRILRRHSPVLAAYAWQRIEEPEPGTANVGLASTRWSVAMREALEAI